VLHDTKVVPRLTFRCSLNQLWQSCETLARCARKSFKKTGKPIQETDGSLHKTGMKK
jgi:hypothetical protein